jgi:hypothetical protein
VRLPWRRGARRGEPASGNGASSLHLLWEVPSTPLSAASAVLEVLRVPEVPRLVFWALQVTFSDGARHRGGAHLGLQWNPGFSGCTAANWGGYAPSEIGGLLSGSESALPSIRVDDNTRDFDWKVGRRYRLEVAKAPHPPAGLVAWRGTITDLETGIATVVRDLYTDAEHLLLPMVWTESFLRCDQPGVAARWSELTVTLADGAVVRPGRVMVNYQAPERGGCGNTSVSLGPNGIVQETGVKRQIAQGKVLQA